MNDQNSGKLPAAVEMGRLGGRAGHGDAKRRPAEHYAAIAGQGGAAGRGPAKRRSKEHYQRAAQLSAQARKANRAAAEILASTGV